LGQNRRERGLFLRVMSLVMLILLLAVDFIQDAGDEADNVAMRHLN